MKKDFPTLPPGSAATEFSSGHHFCLGENQKEGLCGSFYSVENSSWAQCRILSFQFKTEKTFLNKNLFCSFTIPFHKKSGEEVEQSDLFLAYKLDHSVLLYPQMSYIFFFF